jgi:dTMP kinase
LRGDGVGHPVNLQSRIPVQQAEKPAGARFDNSSALLQTRAMARFPFITFEGTEACGKSTQVQRLKMRLEQSSVPVLVTREPGGTAIGESIRELLQFAPHSSAMAAETELLLFAASRAQLVREVIEPALRRGVCVISDRFFDSTTAYQGAARKLNQRVVEQLNQFAVDDCRPDITFVLDVDLPIAERRLQSHARRADRMEQEPHEFYRAVRRGYRDLAAHEPNRVILIDASRPVEQIADEVWQVLCARFPAIAGRKTGTASC